MATDTSGKARTESARREPLSSSQSLPFRLSEDLLERLRDKEWAPGDRLPSEQQLAGQYRVSRPTVRLAIRRLEEAGLVHVRQGAGAFVTSLAAEIRTGLQDLQSITALIASQGHEPQVVFRSVSLRQPTDEEREQLELSDGEKVIGYERSLSADGSVVAFEYGALAASLFPEDWSINELQGSIFEALEKHSLLPESALAEVVPVLDPTVGWGDGIPENGLYLCLAQTQVLADGSRVSWSRTYFVANSPFRFFILRKR